MINLDLSKLITELVKKDPSKISSNMWFNISRKIPLRFIRENINNELFKFNFMGIASNDSLSTDFLETYYDKFYEDNIHLQLNKNIKVTKEFILQDTHVKTDKELKYKEVKYIPFTFLKCSNELSEESAELCDIYLDTYMQDDDYITECSEVITKLYNIEEYYDIYRNKYCLVTFKDKLYIVYLSYVNKAIDILINGQLKTMDIRFFYSENVVDILSNNENISFDYKLQTLDKFKWNWDVHFLSEDQYEKVKHLLSEDDIKSYKKILAIRKEKPVLTAEYLDALLDKENWYEELLCKFFKKLNKENGKFLKDYKNIEKLIQKLRDVNSVFTINLTPYVPLEIIEKYHYAKWNLFWISTNEEIPLDFLRKIKEKVNWTSITLQNRITEDIVINNLDLPWDLNHLINNLSLDSFL